jgi:hypothetical protein
VQPYNTLLAAKRLVNNADSVVMVDNLALHKLIEDNMEKQEASFRQTNQLVSWNERLSIGRISRSTRHVSSPGVDGDGGINNYPSIPRIHQQ